MIIDARVALDARVDTARTLFSYPALLLLDVNASAVVDMKMRANARKRSENVQE